MKENSLMKRSQIRFFLNNKKCSIPALLISVLILILVVVLVSSHKSFSSSSSSTSHASLLSSDSSSAAAVKLDSLPELPRFAYLISGTKGDVGRLIRLLQSVYHPRNYYLLHLDLEASDSERLELAKYVKSQEVLRRFSNVMVMGKADLITSKGPTVIASTLHAVAILLKQAKRWDWFINLSASDYPLMRQDGLSFYLSH